MKTKIFFITILIMLTLSNLIILFVNACDEDYDKIPDIDDNCPFVYNPDQADNDGDEIGDVCDDDDDNDGYNDDVDCAALDPAINPGAIEICGDGIDQDCSGSDLSCDDVDNDGDGYSENKGDCDDSDASVYPGAIEVCGDGIDNDCNGLTDEDCEISSDESSSNKVIRISIYQKPTAIINGTYMGVPNEYIQFDATESHDNDEEGKSIIRFDYKFQDEQEWQINLGSTPSYIYSKAGVYYLWLRVVDDEGRIDIDTTTVTILKPNSPPTKPEINGLENGTTNELYYYTVVSSDEDGDVLKYTIDWDDGTTKENYMVPSGIFFSATHKWIKPGTYKITVTADDNYTISTNELTIEINQSDKKESTFPWFLLFLLIFIILIFLLFLILEKRHRDKKIQTETGQTAK